MTAETNGRNQSGPPAARTRSDRLGRWLGSLSIGALATVVGVSIAALAVATMATAVVGSSWLNHTRSVSEQWADSEEHIHHIHQLAGGQFLDIVDATSGIPDQSSAPPDDLIIDHATNLIAATASERFADQGARLVSAASEFDAALAMAKTADTATLRASFGPQDRLESAYTALHAALGEFSGEMRAAQSETMATLSRRADTVVLILAGLFLLGIATLVLAWTLGVRARRREQTLVARISSDRWLLQTVVDSLPESIVWKNTESEVLGLNEALRHRLEHHNVPVLLNTRFSDAPMTEAMVAYIGEVEAMERLAMKTGDPVLNRQMTRPESIGNDLQVLRTAIPLRRNGEIIGVLSTTRDITAVVDLERSLASAQRLESIGQLAAGVAHEINTPVQFVSDNTAFLDTSFTSMIEAITSLSEIAEQEDPEAVASIRKETDLEFLLEDVPDAMQQSREGLQQIADIVRAMKAFAHPGGEIAPTNINGLITTTVAITRNEWKYHADIDLDLDDDLPQPATDEGQIKQVLLNLIVNAADAVTDAGNERGTITITTRPVPNGVSIAIADTGIGMSPEVQERIYERFFTTKQAGRGSGQGLAIAYDAVTAHGGDIQVESAVGVGTTFTITLPLRPPEKTRSDRPAIG
jgi:signal transduction histidine kinase